MNIDYFDLLNPNGVFVRNVGRIHSPRLKDISMIGHREYNYYLSILISTPTQYFERILTQVGMESEKINSILFKVEESGQNMFDVFTSDELLIDDLQNALSLFIDGGLIWDGERSVFMVNAKMVDDKVEIDGEISHDNFEEVSDICLQMAYIEKRKPEVLKFKNETARKFYYEFQKKKETYYKNKKADKNFELANMVSAVSAHHENLNPINVWDLTVYQLHDCFSRLAIKRNLQIHETNYSVWGGEYDPKEWFASMKNENNNSI